jgi:hypothetical protein
MTELNEKQRIAHERIENLFVRLPGLADCPEDQLVAFCKDWTELSPRTRNVIYARLWFLVREGTLTMDRRKVIEGKFREVGIDKPNWRKSYKGFNIPATG